MRPVWNDSLLDSIRKVGDPIADGAIGEYIAAHDGVTPRTVMCSMVASMHPGTQTFTPQLQAYFDDMGSLPSWADPELIARGQRVFAARGLEIATALFCASLPTAYAAKKGAEVIFTTADLVSTPHRRIAETAHMICDVMSIELDQDGTDADTAALAGGTRGYNAARGVRLMHAAVRQFVHHDLDAQRRACAGESVAPTSADVPVNQEDLVGTLLTFTTVVFDAIERLGSPLTRLDQEAYLHAWCVVGFLLGIRSDLLPLGVDEARALDMLIRRRQNASGHDGEALASALVGEMRSNLPPRLRGLPTALVRRLAGDQVGDVLQLDRSTWTMRRVVGIGVDATRLWYRYAPNAARNVVGIRLSRRMIRRYVDRGRPALPPWDFSPYWRKQLPEQ